MPSWIILPRERQGGYGQQHWNKERIKLAQPQRLGEHTPADDEEMGGGIQLTDNGAKTLHTGYRVQQTRELHRRYDSDNGRTKNRCNLAFQQ